MEYIFCEKERGPSYHQFIKGNVDVQNEWFDKKFFPIDCVIICTLLSWMRTRFSTKWLENLLLHVSYWLWYGNTCIIDWIITEMTWWIRRIILALPRIWIFPQIYWLIIWVIVRINLPNISYLHFIDSASLPFCDQITRI